MVWVLVDLKGLDQHLCGGGRGVDGGEYGHGRSLCSMGELDESANAKAVMKQSVHNYDCAIELMIFAAIKP